MTHDEFLRLSKRQQEKIEDQFDDQCAMYGAVTWHDWLRVVYDYTPPLGYKCPIHPEGKHQYLQIAGVI